MLCAVLHIILFLSIPLVKSAGFRYDEAYAYHDFCEESFATEQDAPCAEFGAQRGV